MAEVKTVTRTLHNPNACVNHVQGVAGLVTIGPGQTVEVEVDEAVSKKLDKAVARKVFAEDAPKAKPADKTGK